MIRKEYLYLFRDLIEVINEFYGGCFFQWVIYVVDIYLIFIKKMMEDIYSFYCSRVLLFIVKD